MTKTQPVETQSRVTDPVTLVVFGASGDLARRKLIPALFAAYVQKLLPQHFAVMGVARREYDDVIFRDLMGAAIQEFSREPADAQTIGRFVEHLHFHRGDITEPEVFTALAEQLRDTETFPANRIYYLSIAPMLFGPTVRSLHDAGLITPCGAAAWTRVVVEKPFGKDLESARALNTELLQYLGESQIYRMDHYLGKETVQNILTFRFANAIFEPVFNRSYVDHVQITAGETVGMESGRGGYYDESGAVRDMVTNHLLQLLCFIAMEPPGDLSSESIRNEKVKVLNATQLDIYNDLSDAVCRGQYAAGNAADGSPMKGYLDEDRIEPDSETETFAALRVRIDNWRWSGVPFYLRTGKRMARKATEIAVQFKVPPLQLFQQVECEGDRCDLTHIRPNTLIFRIQPNEGIFLHIGTKRPGMRFVVEDVKMDFSYSGMWSKSLPEAYERLLLDVMNGDPTLFTRSDEVEAEWRVVQPFFNQHDSIALHPYRPNSWGPAEADALFAETSRVWRNVDSVPL